MWLTLFNAILNTTQTKKKPCSSIKTSVKIFKKKKRENYNVLQKQPTKVYRIGLPWFQTFLAYNEVISAPTSQVLVFV